MWDKFLIPITGIATYYLYYKIFVCKKPNVYTSNTKLQTLLSKVKILKEKYNPPLLFFGGQIQTILSISQRVIKDIPYEREIIDLKDGGIAALDFLGEKSRTDRPLMLFLPGLTSSSQTTYVKTLVSEFSKYCDIIVFNNRGIGGVPFKTPRTYSASNIDDLQEVVAHIQSNYKERTLIAVGTSLGGMVLSKYLTTEKVIPFKYAMLICIPWDSEMGSRNLEKPYINRYLINQVLTKGLVKLAGKMEKSLGSLPGYASIDKIRKCKTVRDFDKIVTAPQFGFKTVEDYYEFNSTKDLSKFTIPVIGISAEDDPIQPGEFLPIKDVQEKNSNVALITTAHGGHLGYLEGMSKKSVHYMEKLCGEIISLICKEV